MQKTYETDRLILKTLDSSDAPAILHYYLKNRDFLEEWEATRASDFYTLPYHAATLDNEKKNNDSGTALRLWMFKKDKPQIPIGCIGFNSIIRGAFLSCFLSYKCDKDELNKGFVTEAVRKGIEVIFDEYGLHRIEANILPRNTRSLRVVEKLGFRSEGLARDYLKINGKWEDHIHMVLLNNKI